MNWPNIRTALLLLVIFFSIAVIIDSNKKVENKEQPNSRGVTQVKVSPSVVLNVTKGDENGIKALAPISVSVSDLAEVPEKYIKQYLNNGQTLTFSCIANRFIKDEDKRFNYLTCVDAKNHSTHVLIDGFNIDPTKVEYGDEITIEGFADKTIDGISAFGVEVTSTVVWPIFFTDKTSGYKF